MSMSERIGAGWLIAITTAAAGCGGGETGGGGQHEDCVDPRGGQAADCGALGLAAGGTFTCALLSGGVVKCWGGNDQGQLGLADTRDRGNDPGEMGGKLHALNLGTGRTAVAVGAGDSHACALMDGAGVKCWGSNFDGQLGRGDTVARGDDPKEMGDRLPAVDLGSDRTVAELAVGYYHGCAVLDDGSLKCWGSNSGGQLGQGDGNYRGDEPSEMGDALPAVDLGTGARAVGAAAGGVYSCAVLGDGRVKCWGDNAVGQLGLGDTKSRGDGPDEMGDSLPAVDLGSSKTVVAVVTGLAQTCALFQDGSVKCWGWNAFGQLGLGDAHSRGDNVDEMGANLPEVNLGAGRKATALSAGSNHTCALLDDGSVKCWGGNYHGQLGLGDMSSRGNEPHEMGDALPAVDLGEGQTAIAISAGRFHTCALLDGGGVKCWGRNDAGQLGLGDMVSHGDEPDEMADRLPRLSLF